MKIGDSVHYVSYGTPGGEFSSQCRAATITEVLSIGTDIEQPRASLAVLNPTGLFFDRNLPYSTGREGGTWHLAEKCDR